MSSGYLLSKEAEKDWYKIGQYTLKNFGERKLLKYTEDLTKCLDDLVNDIAPIRILEFSGHQILIKKCNKHYVFALKERNEPLLILAFLHEKMDLMNRLRKRLK